MPIAGTSMHQSSLIVNQKQRSLFEGQHSWSSHLEPPTPAPVQTCGVRAVTHVRLMYACRSMLMLSVWHVHMIIYAVWPYLVSCRVSPSPDTISAYRPVIDYFPLLASVRCLRSAQSFVLRCTRSACCACARQPTNSTKERKR